MCINHGESRPGFAQVMQKSFELNNINIKLCNRQSNTKNDILVQNTCIYQYLGFAFDTGNQLIQCVNQILVMVVDNLMTSLKNFVNYLLLKCWMAMFFFVKLYSVSCSFRQLEMIMEHYRQLKLLLLLFYLFRPRKKDEVLSSRMFVKESDFKIVLPSSS